VPRTVAGKITIPLKPGYYDEIVAWMIRQPPPVLTKKGFVTRYSTGEFGNASPTWNTPDLLLDWGAIKLGESSDDTTLGLFHLRNRQTAGQTYYNIGWADCVGRWFSQANRKEWYASQMAPTERTILQGEVQQGTNGLELFYTTVAKPMRDALRERSEQVYGITAVSLLRRYLCPNSYEWLQVLLDRYPFHVVEFSSYSCNWGTIPGYNTVFWEIRKY
jgi:hypothetical protein